MQHRVDFVFISANRRDLAKYFRINERSKNPLPTVGENTHSWRGRHRHWMVLTGEIQSARAALNVSSIWRNRW